MGRRAGRKRLTLKEKKAAGKSSRPPFTKGGILVVGDGGRIISPTVRELAAAYENVMERQARREDQDGKREL